MRKKQEEAGTHLEQLDSDDSEEELEEQRDHHNVADGFDGNNDALDDMLEAFSSVDGT